MKMKGNVCPLAQFQVHPQPPVARGCQSEDREHVPHSGELCSVPSF
jgi:hypothetical protein